MTQYDSKCKIASFLNNQVKIRNKKWYWSNFKSFANVIDNYNDNINLPHNLLLTNAQVLRLHKAFANNLSAHRKWAETSLFKMVG